MAFKEIASLEADTTVALGKKDKKTGKPYPKQAEGYYLGTRVIEGQLGESKLHFLQTASGNLGVWGTTDLNRQISNVGAGTMVRITSTGTKPTPKGNMYTYKVEQDADNTIEVLSAGSNFSNVEEDTEVESNDEENDGPTYSHSNNAAADRVKALLNKSNRTVTKN